MMSNDLKDHCLTLVDLKDDLIFCFPQLAKVVTDGAKSLVGSEDSERTVIDFF